jgi:hypothetical protein
MQTPEKLHAFIKHQTFNRIRLQLRDPGISLEESKEHFIEILSRLQTILQDTEGIKNCKINPHTKTILIQHNNCLEKVISVFKVMEIPLFKPESTKAREKLPQMRQEIKQKIRKWDQNIIEFTDGELDLNFIVGLTMGAMGYYQTFKGRKFLPPGEDLLVNGLKRLLDETALEDEI